MTAEYEVTINGLVHHMMLDPEDAQRWYGGNAKPVEAKQVVPKNKARQPQNKGDQPDKP